MSRRRRKSVSNEDLWYMGSLIREEHFDPDRTYRFVQAADYEAPTPGAKNDRITDAQRGIGIIREEW